MRGKLVFHLILGEKTPVAHIQASMSQPPLSLSQGTVDVWLIL